MRNKARKHPLITINGDNLDRYKAGIEKILEEFSDHELALLEDKGVSIEVRNSPPENIHFGTYDGRSKILTLFPDFNNPGGPPIVDFEFVVAHELMHAVLHSNTSMLYFGYNQQELRNIAKMVLKKVRAAAPIETAIVEKALGTYLHSQNRKDLQPLLALLASELAEDKKQALNVAIFMNENYYLGIPFYRQDPNIIPEEMACNLKALMHTFGREKIYPVAGEFLDSIDALVESCPAPSPEMIHQRKLNKELGQRLDERERREGGGHAPMRRG